MVKNLPASQETQRPRFSSLVRKIPLKEGMATHSRILPWRIPWTGGPGIYSPWDFEESDMAEGLSNTRGSVVFLGLPERETSTLPCPGGPGMKPLPEETAV